MIRCLIPIEKEFFNYYQEIKDLYEKSKDKIGDTNSFDFIINNTFFYLFENNGRLIGGIYLFEDEGKLWLNGFANRKMHLLCLECLKMTTKWFDCDIYAKAKNKMSALCLLKCGFQRVKDNIFRKNAQ